MKAKKIVIIMLAATVIITGCSHQNNIGGKKESNSAIKTFPVTPTMGAETATPSVSPTGGGNEREDAPVEYAEANYFKEKVRDIIYYRDGKKYTVSPDTEQGKQIILMVKQRYVNTCEYVLRKNKLKKQFSTLIEKGRALEIKFAKQCFTIYTGGRRNDYKKVSMNYWSWFYPLEGDEAEYFMPLPNQECTYGRLGDARPLLDYLEKWAV